VALLAHALDAGASASRALIEPAFQPLHGNREYRELLRRHAHESKIVLVAPDEPGETLTVSGVVRDADGKPVAGALIYVFHTDARGYYSTGGMDEDNPRLFGFLNTGADGRYEFRTVRPGGYHDDSEVDQHVHYFVEAEGYAPRSDRLGFTDDPVWRRHAAPQPWARPVTRDAGGMQRCTFDITLQRAG
jgi:protocatechuate 3,4-dioxygenase beta subunit